MEGYEAGEKIIHDTGSRKTIAFLDTRSSVAIAGSPESRCDLLWLLMTFDSHHSAPALSATAFGVAKLPCIKAL